MPSRSRRGAAPLAALFAALLLLHGTRAAGSPHVILRAGTVQEYLDIGMPLSAKRAFLALPPASRRASPHLPALLGKLAAGGHGPEALSLFDAVRNDLVEPVRSDAHFAAGKILWERGEIGKAVRAFREVGAASAGASRAAIYRARALAAEGNAEKALKTLASVPDGAVRRQVEGEIEMTRGNRTAAEAAWAGPPGGGPPTLILKILSLSHGDKAASASRELGEIAGAPSTGIPERAAATRALALSLLSGGDAEGALRAAREGIAHAAGWKTAAANSGNWDGTKAGADRTWKEIVGLFPQGDDAGPLFAAGGAFLSAATLARTAAAAGNGVRETSRRVRGAADAVSRERAIVADKERMSGEFRGRLLSAGRRAAAMRGRAREAADSLPLSDRGSAAEPRTAALLRLMDGKLEALSARAARVKAAADAAATGERARALSAEERRMALFAQGRAARIEDRIYALEGRASLLRGKVLNRWKSAWSARISTLLDGGDNAARLAADAAKRAEGSGSALRRAGAALESWQTALAAHGNRLAGGLSRLDGRRAEARAAAERALGEARRELAASVAREERAARYVAARAATAVLAGGKADDAALSPPARRALSGEARAHWEASLPPAGERGVATDEALYALAELGFDEAASRHHEEGGREGGSPDYSAPAALYRRVVDEFPGSPYAEPALYGLALCRQEAGDADGSAGILADLLARHPRTRYADEIRLRLGEHLFDRYEYRDAAEEYRKVGEDAAPELRTTALFKLGWSLFLLERPNEALEPFLAAMLLSPAAKTGGVAGESLRMLARSLLDAGMDKAAEEILSRRGASAHGPAVLLKLQEMLDAQNRYAEAAAVADRLGAAWPADARRVDAEVAAAEALRKGGKPDEGFARRAKLPALFGPGSRWRAAPGRTDAETARADAVSEEGLRAAAFHFHDATREEKSGAGRVPPLGRREVLALYDAYLSLFPGSTTAEEVAFRRAWLLFEDGRKGEAGEAFESVARLPGGTRGEASRYMAIQCAKDASPGPGAGPEEVERYLAVIVRLCLEYERAHPAGGRLASILLDRARAQSRSRRFAEAAGAADAAAGLLPKGEDRLAALALSGEARFETGDFSGAEQAFRTVLAEAAEAAGRAEAGKWVGFSMFRRAETMSEGNAAEAARLFARTAREFPFLDIAPVALFRSGASSVVAGKTGDAVSAFLAVESGGAADPSLALDATRRLAELYEKTGDRAAAAGRHERLAAADADAGGKAKHLLRAADLFAGADEARSRRNLLAAASLPGMPPALRVSTLFRAAESARAEGNADEADRHYGEAVKAHEAAPEAAPAVAGRALFRRADLRFGKYRALSIVPPLESTFAAKQAALEGSAALYLESIRIGDAETVAASLHRLGEGFEDFRSAILASPPPKGLSPAEKEEYVFLLEEKAAPIEERAVEAYRKNLRQAVAADFFSPWVAKSLERLKAMRPARFSKKWEYAFPVVTVPDFGGIIVRTGR